MSLVNIFNFFFSGVLFGFAVVQTTRYCACCTVKAQEKTLKRISVSLLCQKLFLVVKVIYDVFGIFGNITKISRKLFARTESIGKMCRNIWYRKLKTAL